MKKLFLIVASLSMSLLYGCAGTSQQPSPVEKTQYEKQAAFFKNLQEQGFIEK